MQTFEGVRLDFNCSAAQNCRFHLFTAFFLPVFAIAMGSGVWLSCGKPSKSSATKIQNTLHLDTFVLNLAGADERAYLRVGVDLGLRSQSKKEADSAAPVALVRDTILGVLSSARPDDVLTSQGKQTLKTNILHALHERVPELEVQEVYFTEFLIQR